MLDISPLSTSTSISTLPVFVEIMRKLQVPPSYNMPQARTYVDEMLATVVPVSDKWLIPCQVHLDKVIPGL